MKNAFVYLVNIGLLKKKRFRSLLWILRPLKIVLLISSQANLKVGKTPICPPVNRQSWLPLHVVKAGLDSTTEQSGLRRSYLIWPVCKRIPMGIKKITILLVTRIVFLHPSRHMVFMQRCIHVDATSCLASTIRPRRQVPPGIVLSTRSRFSTEPALS